MATKWICTCGNTNVTKICPNCNKTEIKPLSQDEKNALDCQNRAAVGNGMYNAVSKDSFTTNNQNRKYFTAIYTFAREPLLKQIEQLEADLKYRVGLTNCLQQDKDILTQKVADLQAKLSKSRRPKVGDVIWTVPLGDIGHPNRAVQRTVNEIKEEGFGVDGFGLIRNFDDKGKTWWFTKPKGAKNVKCQLS